MRLRATLFFTVTLGSFSTTLCAQEAVPAAGGDGSGNGGSISWTVGLIVYTTHQGTDGSVAQGVQHAYTIYALDDPEEEDSEISLSLYPNPTLDVLNLFITGFSGDNWHFLLYDPQGKLVERQPITQHATLIDISRHAAASYFLHVFHENDPVQSFKIIKSQGR